MSIEDKPAIHDVIARYSHTYDGLDAGGFALLFVEDGIFEVFVAGTPPAVVRLQSRAAIHAWAATRLEARRGALTSRHHQSGTVFDALTVETAETRTMVLITHQRTGESAPRPKLTGIYHDRWLKTAVGWRLTHRTAHVDGPVDATDCALA
jgi:hypothetical protein